MLEFIYIPIILILYLRTYKYCNIVDDSCCPTEKYYLWITDYPRPPKEFYDQKRPKKRVTGSIFMLILTCLTIHLTFGWKVALLYCVFPVCVCGTAWLTGWLYQYSTFQIVTAYYFATHFGIIGTALSVLFYWGSLLGVISALPYPFLLLFVCPQAALWHVPTLLTFLFGKRFRNGLKQRTKIHENLNMRNFFTFNRVFVAVKTLSYHICLFIWPSRLAFFHDFGLVEMKGKTLYKPDKLFFESLVLLILFVLCGAFSPLGVIWTVLFCGLYSQFFGTYGQDFSERYLLIGSIGFLMIISSFLDTFPIIYAILCTLYFCKSWEYIPAYKHNKNLFIYGCTSHPQAFQNHNNVAAYYIERGIFLSAIPYLLTALKITPGSEHFNILSNIMICYKKSGHFETALNYARQSLNNCPQDQKENLEAEILQLEERLNLIDKNKKLLRKKGII